MKKMFSFVLVLWTVLFALACHLSAQDLQTIKLNPPDKTRGLPFMETLSVKASAREWSERELSIADLSDLLWAATGINRPEENKTTASSALNAHDVDVYLFMKEGVYLYDIANHELDPVLSGDHRSELMMGRPPRPAGAPNAPDGPPAGPPPGGFPAREPMGSTDKKPESGQVIPPAAGPGGPPPGQMAPPPSNPPVQIILVSNSERFRMGEQNLRYEWGAIDAGIVSQNISLFCAATGLKTRPRASIQKDKIKALLNLKDTQYVLLNHPVGYAR